MAQTFTVKTVIAWRRDALSEQRGTHLKLTVLVLVHSWHVFAFWLRQSTKFEIIAKTANSEE